MKSAAFLFFFFAQSALALPVVCHSHEKTNNLSTLRIKINPKTRVRQNGQVWNLHVIGVTAQEPTEKLHRMYGSGGLRPESMKMTIVKDGAVYGYVDADSPERNGIYDGKIRIGGVLRGRVIDVRCFDEEIHGEIVP